MRSRIRFPREVRTRELHEGQLSNQPGPCLTESTEDSLVARKPVLWGILLCVLFLLGLAARLPYLDAPPLKSHGTRQLHSATIARAFYYRGAVKGLSEPQRRAALAAGEKENTLEPPVMERLAAFGYRLLGREALWLPRLLAAFFWVVGGWFVYRIARSIASASAGLFSTFFYLFLPFSVYLSRNFQPDPLMIMLMLAGMDRVVAYHQKPTPARLILAAAVCAAALLVKPVCVFLVFGSFLALSVSNRGLRRGLLDPALAGFAVIALLPTALYYGYGLFAVGSLRNQAQMSFIPRLLLDPRFWSGWLRHILGAVGLAALLGGLLGIQLHRKGSPRALLLGLWGSYLFFGVVFNYHIKSHDYYQLQLVPVVALSIGPLCAWILRNAWHANPQRFWRTATVGVLAVGILAAGLEIHSSLWVNRPEIDRQVALAEEVGELVHHSTKTIYLSRTHGKPLLYYGHVSGQAWPRLMDFYLPSFQPMKSLTAEERMKRLDPDGSAEYFIVTRFSSLDAQPGLKALLEKRPVVAEGKGFRIFDLRPAQP